MRKLVLLVAALVAAVVAATAVGSAAAGGNGGETFTPRVGHALGIVPTWAASMAAPWANGAYRATYGSGKLYNHGGPTLTTNATYAIYWQPSNVSGTFPS